MSEPRKVSYLKFSDPFGVLWRDYKVVQVEIDLFHLIDHIDYHDFPSSTEFTMDEKELTELMEVCKSLLKEIKALSPKAKRSKKKMNKLTINMNYRVWRITNLDGDGNGKHSDTFYVESPAEGARLINALSIIDLQAGEKVVSSNVFGLEVKEGKKWEEWMDDDGNDIMEMADEYFDYLKQVNK